MKEIYLAGGCFWGVEHFFSLIDGVVKAEAGYANGNGFTSPSYEEVYTDKTGFAETVKVTYNPDKIGLDSLISLYFKIIDPVSLNRQGHDEGTRYRTVIFYSTAEDYPVIKAVYDELENKSGQKFVVELCPLENFFKAEEYHQEYLVKNPSGYCHLPLEVFRWARHYKAGDPIE